MFWLYVAIFRLNRGYTIQCKKKNDRDEICLTSYVSTPSSRRSPLCYFITKIILKFLIYIIYTTFIVYHILQYLCFDVRRDIAHNILLHCIVLYIFSCYEPVFSLKMITCSWLSPTDKVVFWLDLHSFYLHCVTVTNINKRHKSCSTGTITIVVMSQHFAHSVNQDRTNRTQFIYLFIYNLFNHTASTSNYMVSNGSMEIMWKALAWLYWGNLPEIF